MNKNHLLELIIKKLTLDSEIQLNAAKTAHEASTDEENIPDNKYETLALEASYLAQGQANRAQEIKRAMSAYRGLELKSFDNESRIGVTALVTLANAEDIERVVFIGPLEGGMRITDRETEKEIVVITPASPLGRNLIGKSVGDSVLIGADRYGREFEIIEVI
ncbi:MAG: GreA/GreB family elongation factor [Desulfuromonadaceae bacterium]|nr:GreA/GreB family elongation factor [Desulfuromonadaceae bacterium]MDD2856074.1 GreA/GreB family elongation factor [Desulfuromonadaceae bacterium]